MGSEGWARGNTGRGSGQWTTGGTYNLDLVPCPVLFRVHSIQTQESWVSVLSNTSRSAP